MNFKYTYSVCVALLLVGSIASGRAQAVPAGPTVVPPQGPVTMRPGGELQGFQFVGGEPSISTHVVKGAPYSLEATIESAQTLADGNRIVHQQTVHLYRDSKGRTRREETLAAIGPWAASGAPPTMITIQDPVSGVSYFLDPQRKTATKLPATPIGKGVMVTGGMVGGEAGSGPAVASVTVERGLVSSPDQGPDVFFSGGQVTQLDEKSETLGKETIAGISADGTRTTSTIPANTMGNERALDIVRERWYSPELQIVLRSKQADPRFGETTYAVTKVDRGEPALSLFEVPSDYKILKGDAHFLVRHDPDSK